MKNISLKFHLSLIALFLSLITLYSQTGQDCLVVNFPAIDTSTEQGGKICLQGVPDPPGDSNTRDICFSNKEGYLKIGLAKMVNTRYNFDIENFLLGNADSGSHFGLTILGSSAGTDQYNNNNRDITFEYPSAGKAIIRSLRGGSNDTFLQFFTSPQNNANPEVRMQINADGKVLIGGITTFNNNPGDYKLYVTGGILSEKFKAAIYNSSQWSDHVFYETYRLKPLPVVEKYIQENGHLPGVPSADELIKDGIDLVDMQAKQMEKIEELTLYLIEMNKKLEKLTVENEELKTKLDLINK